LLNKSEVYETPIIRKIIDVGKTSKGITLPKSWLENFERETGKQITEVAMEVNGSLTIQPILPKAPV
jgi:hypothetical protein